MAASASAQSFRALARSRYSTKRFQPNRLIPDSVLRDIIETSLTSPSGFNLQPTNVILVKCPNIKKQLSQNAMLGVGNAYKTIDASALAVFLADLEVHKRIDRIVELEQKANARHPGYMYQLPLAASLTIGEGHAATLVKQIASNALSPIQPMPNIENVESWSYKNASLMAQTYVLAATSHGLATSMMEGFDSRRAREILRVPDRYGLPLMVATGYEYEGEDGNGENYKKTPRLDVDEVFFGDTFGEQLSLKDDEES